MAGKNNSFLRAEQEYPMELNLMNSILCSNVNRVAILHLLKNVQKNEMQAEKVAYSLGISHRTTLYHLAILEECGLIEVRKFRRKGTRVVRSVWGLSKNRALLDNIFIKICETFNCAELDEMIKKRVMPR